MAGLRSLIRKEFQQLRRDRRLLPIVFIAPVIQLLVLGYAANLDVRDIPTLLCDQDGSAVSRELASAFFRSGYFTLEASVATATAAEQYIDRGRAAMAIMIPRGFGAALSAGHPAQLQVIADGSRSYATIIGLNYAAMIVDRSEARLRASPASPGSPTPPGIALETRIWYNPELKSRNFLVPGILALLLMVMTMLLTSLAIVKEKETGTLEQLIVTPLSSRVLILGKLLPFALIGFVDVLLVLAAAYLLFGIGVSGSLLLLLALSAVFLLTTLGLGLLVSTVSRNQQQAMMTAVFFVMLPMVFLSGFVFPIENMPVSIQALTYLLPLRYYFVIVRGLFLKGVGLVELWHEALALLVFGIVIFMISVLRFRKRLE
jgi:ABC-2 type transport system permease protein